VIVARRFSPVVARSVTPVVAGRFSPVVTRSVTPVVAGRFTPVVARSVTLTRLWAVSLFQILVDLLLQFCKKNNKLGILPKKERGFCRIPSRGLRGVFLSFV
jgi:hypothetical protein